MREIDYTYYQDEVPFAGKRVKHRIYELLVSHPEGISRELLTTLTYANDPDGGPESGDNSISAHLWGMRKLLLSEFDIDIVSDNHGCGGTTYHLKTIPSTR